MLEQTPETFPRQKRKMLI